MKCFLGNCTTRAQVLGFQVSEALGSRLCVQSTCFATCEPPPAMSNAYASPTHLIHRLLYIYIYRLRVLQEAQELQCRTVTESLIRTQLWMLVPMYASGNSSRHYQHQRHTCIYLSLGGKVSPVCTECIFGVVSAVARVKDLRGA